MCEEIELRDEHCGYAVEGRGAVGADGGEGGVRGEGFGWEDDGGAVCGGGHVA